MIHPVIMAGGTGSRLWPMSRQLNPKQFLKLTNGPLSMLQATVARLEGMDAANPLLICNEEHRFLAAEQMRQSGHEDTRIILEPCGRNTAPAMALAALQLTEAAENGADDPLMLVLAADHLIKDVAAFQEGVKKAIPLAREGKLVTFGIVPDQPETGYGYIHRGSELGPDSFAVDRFVEKPDLAT
ncbi:MAG: sugar phosphate nucleotidyltransferase, partial [Pseudomonadota bacterium]|nr:sugar phosphate nucleotidyltransferase [Pseudomonadota bacterium]